MRLTLLLLLICFSAQGQVQLQHPYDSRFGYFIIDTAWCKQNNIDMITTNTYESHKYFDSRTFKHRYKSKYLLKYNTGSNGVNIYFKFNGQADTLSYFFGQPPKYSDPFEGVECVIEKDSGWVKKVFHNTNWFMWQKRYGVNRTDSLFYVEGMVDTYKGEFRSLLKKNFTYTPDGKLLEFTMSFKNSNNAERSSIKNTYASGQVIAMNEYEKKKMVLNQL